MKHTNLKLHLLYGILIVILGIYFLLPRLVTQIKIPFLYQENTTENSEIQTYFTERDKQAKFFKLKTFDHLNLDGFYVLSTQDSIRGSLILLHGIRSSKGQFKAQIDSITEYGYNCFAIDLRAHNLSEGTHCTFGFKEKKDVYSLIDFIENKKFSNPKIGILGYSLGGAIAIQSLAEDKRLKFGIIQSSYSQFDILIHDYVKRLTKIDSKLFSNFLIQRASKIAEMNSEKLNSIDYVTKIEQPVLFFHGTKDDRININYGEENFRNLRSKSKQFIPIENANHVNLEKVGKQNYWKPLKNFLTLQP